MAESRSLGIHTPRTQRPGTQRDSMKHLFFLIFGALCVSCSTVDGRKAKAISLPQLTMEGVNLDDGLQEQEAATLSSAYFDRYISGCGMPDKPQEEALHWRVQLWGGFGGSDFGTLRLAKDGSHVLLSPPRGGFKSSTQQLLRQQNVGLE